MCQYSMLMMGCCWLGPVGKLKRLGIQMAIEVSGECGLNINKGKSNLLLFNHDGIRLESLEEPGGWRNKCIEYNRIFECRYGR